ncbi:MAG TPA: hypothetical protein VFE60_25555 [Roseiarcus sp.]|jgi:hypothetical protein|nr:hypothetical protein [Roseiarcus sp.]
MSNQFHHRHSYSRYFMAPVWIALALCGMGVAFLLGGALVTDEWSRQDNEKLADYKPGGPVVVPVASESKADGSVGNVGTTETSPPKPESLSTLVWRSPASALEWAAEGVKHDRIEFAIYRNLLRATLAQQDAGAHQIAFRSIRDVLQYGGAFADDLKAELKGMAPQVFITTTTSQAGIDAGVALEKELRDVGMTIVNRDARDPVQIGESKVSCYGADTCKDARTLLPLLRGRGYAVTQADASSRSEENSDDMAATLYGAKVIRVALMDPKLTQSAEATPHASGPKPHAGKTAHRAVKHRVQTANRPVQTAIR